MASVEVLRSRLGIAERLTPAALTAESRIGSNRMRLCAVILGAILLHGCATMFTRSTPPEYYQVDYPAQAIDCQKPFPGAVRVWPFTASAPYDREQMIAIAPSQKVRFSSTYKWVVPPGNMIADKLLRDLSLGTAFQEAVPVGNPMPAEYEMSGQIYRFALEENGPPPHAVLDVEITLWREKPVRMVVFRKFFHYTSAPLSEADPAEFAGAISGLVAQLSRDLGNDLCAVMQGNSHPAGG